jgi:hypothetical protein
MLLKIYFDKYSNIDGKSNYSIIGSDINRFKIRNNNNHEIILDSDLFSYFMFEDGNIIQCGQKVKFIKDDKFNPILKKGSKDYIITKIINLNKNSIITLEKNNQKFTTNAKNIIIQTSDLE